VSREGGTYQRPSREQTGSNKFAAVSVEGSDLFGASGYAEEALDLVTAFFARASDLLFRLDALKNHAQVRLGARFMMAESAAMSRTKD
jgi:hypothetical protein